MAKIFTNVLLSEEFVIRKEMGFTAVSILLTEGTGTYNGALKILSINSKPINLEIDKPVTITVNEPNVIEDLMITCESGGTINIIARQ